MTGRNSVLLMCLFIPLCVSGCSARTKNSIELLRGSLAWSRGDYQEATACFLAVSDAASQTGDSEAVQYGLYGLSVSYLAQNETEAAMTRMEKIAPDAPPGVRFGVLYNSGIVRFREGDYGQAADFFREALRVNPSSIDAKINLELSLSMKSSSASEGVQDIVPVRENNDSSSVRDTLFSIIREKDQNQWKNTETQEENNGVIDY